jgi:hypothetical protein
MGYTTNSTTKLTVPRKTRKLHNSADLTSACGALKKFQLKRSNPLRSS